MKEQYQFMYMYPLSYVMQHTIDSYYCYYWSVCNYEASI